jgi:hypothetical protein
MSDNASSEKKLLVTLGVVGLLVLYQHLLVLKLMLAIKSPHHARPFFFWPYCRICLIDAPTTTSQQPNPKKNSPPPPTKFHNK